MTARDAAQPSGKPDSPHPRAALLAALEAALRDVCAACVDGGGSGAQWCQACGAEAHPGMELAHAPGCPVADARALLDIGGE